MSRKTRMIQYLAKHNALDAAAIEKIMEMKDGGPGSGNFGHSGRPGKVGGSGKGEGGSGGKVSPKDLKEGEEIRIERPSGKNGIETEIFRRSKSNPEMFESEVSTPWGGNLGKSEVNLNYVNQVLSKTKPGEVTFRGNKPENEIGRLPVMAMRQIESELKKKGIFRRGENWETLKPDVMDDPEARKLMERYAKMSRVRTEGNGREISSGYNPPKTLSPVHEKKSVARRDDSVQKKISSVANDKNALKKELDQMKPGTMLRLNERGYSVFVKGEDGSWEYRRYHGEPQKVSTDEIFDSIQTVPDPKTKKPNPEKAVQAVATPKKGEAGRSAYWDSVRAVANLEPNAGDAYTGKRVTFREALKNGAERLKNIAAGKPAFQKEKGNKSAAYTKEVKDGDVIKKTGRPTSLMPNGTGVTKINKDDIMKTNPDKAVYNTLQEHCMEDANGNLVLTPEREKLHQDSVEELFRDAIKPGPGEEKVCTMMGGGSAAGKGSIQKSGVADLPDAQHSPVIDADELKKRIPEYTDTAFSEDHNKAASMGHEESSAMAKRAFDAAIANGYNFTLDGTGDGNVEGMIGKIKKAQANGYKVKGCYVTCPTELAVKRNAARSQTDEYNRLVPESEVRKIHAKVSKAFEAVAKQMDECKVYDTDQPDGIPKLIAEYKNGKRVFVDKKLFKKFIAKGSEID